VSEFVQCINLACSQKGQLLFHHTKEKHLRKRRKRNLKRKFEQNKFKNFFQTLFISENQKYLLHFIKYTNLNAFSDGIVFLFFIIEKNGKKKRRESSPG